MTDTLLTTTTAERPPLVPGLPLLGNALKLRGDMTRFLVENYHRFGAIYRIRILSRDYTILAGIEANRLLAKQGNDLFTGERFFGGFAREMGNGAFLPAMEDDPHRHLRKVLRPGYAKEAITPHIERLISIAREHVEGWTTRGRVPVVAAIQHLITDQLGIVLGGRALGAYFPYVRDFLRIIVNVTMLGTSPRWTLRSKRYLTARAKTREFLQHLIDDHRITPQGGDLVDLSLDARDREGNPYTNDDLILIGIGAYVAGMDTLANTLSFMLYALLKHPAALAAVRSEAEALLQQGTPTLGDLRSLKALHGAALETLRMYMIAPITMRTARQAFQFGGYDIPIGTDVMVANGVTHFLPEYFYAPNEFRHERTFSGLPANVYTPFSLGAHTCLGAGMAESLLMLSAAVIVTRADLSIDPPNHTAQIVSTPAPNPGDRFAMRVSAKQ
ncbi:MAG TPA: cytochrome P450 [Aggregatilineales bacterium]|nr:cytochrome P450 [Anaerolineales bacterium]HRE48998.1 cytochrome P450 [Aggregatilineales bacterium]